MAEEEERVHPVLLSSLCRQEVVVGAMDHPIAIRKN
jgi:hypothetical protein